MRISNLFAVSMLAIAVATPPAGAVSKMWRPSVACPSQDFEEFVLAFAENESVQMAYTLFPLRYTYLEGGQPVRVLLSDAVISMPILPSSAIRESRGIRLSVVRAKSKSRYEYRLAREFRPGYANPTTYYFSKSRFCWLLEKAEELPISSVAPKR